MSKIRRKRLQAVLLSITLGITSIFGPIHPAYGYNNKIENSKTTTNSEYVIIQPNIVPKTASIIETMETIVEKEEPVVTVAPTIEPTLEPTVAPTIEPTLEPTVAPTVEPTLEPTVKPTTKPTATPKPTIKPTVAPTTKPKSGNSASGKELMSDKEIELIALITMGEAEGEPVKGKRWVIDVILNRMDSDEFPDTVKGVIYQKGQFECTWNGRLSRCEVTEEVKQLVREELRHRTNSEILYFRTDHYHSFGERVGRVGNHYFSK